MLIFNKREWNNCVIKNNQEILLDLADFALPEQPEDNLMVAISRAWNHGSYTKAAKPIKSLELHFRSYNQKFLGGACPRSFLNLSPSAPVLSENGHIFSWIRTGYLTYLESTDLCQSLKGHQERMKVHSSSLGASHIQSALVEQLFYNVSLSSAT